MSVMTALVLAMLIQGEGAGPPAARQGTLNCGSSGADWSSLRPLGPYVSGKGNPYRVPDGPSLYGFRPSELYQRATPEGDQHILENAAIIRGVSYEAVVSAVLRHHRGAACDPGERSRCEIMFSSSEESDVYSPKLIVQRSEGAVSVVCSWVEFDH